MPILANSDASPANSDGPLANFGAFPAATDTYPGFPEPQEPPPLFPIFATHHQLNTPVPPTYSRANPRSQPTPAHSVELRQAPPLQPTHPPQLPPNLQPLTQTIKSSPTLTLTLSAKSVPSHKADPDVIQRTAS
ncbi:hypothetical protein E4T56_gene11367 [Termitomyces sp. T112]|nr:hypothetical protein E4T56_gene11367 [Termitomyces sp. T112]